MAGADPTSFASVKRLLSLLDNLTMLVRWNSQKCIGLKAFIHVEPDVLKQYQSLGQISLTRFSTHVGFGALRNDTDKGKSNRTWITEGFAGNNASSGLGDDGSSAKSGRPQRDIRFERSQRSDQRCDQQSRLSAATDKTQREVFDNFYWV